MIIKVKKIYFMILRDSGCQESFQKDLRSDEIIFLLIGIFFFFEKKNL